MTDLPPPLNDPDVDGILGELAPTDNTRRIDPVAVTQQQAPRPLFAGLRWLFGTRKGRTLYAGWTVFAIHKGLLIQSVVPGLEHPVPVLGSWLLNAVLWAFALIGWAVLPWLRRLDVREQSVRVERTVQFTERAQLPVILLALAYGLMLVTGPGTILGQLVAFTAAPTTSLLGWVGLFKFFAIIWLHLKVLNRSVMNTSLLV